MTAAALLAELRRRGVELWADGERLGYRAPRGALTPELREAVAARKAELLELLRGGPARPAPAQEPGAAPPAEPCYACGGREWWRAKRGPWTCARCHPPAPGVTVAARVTRLPPRSPAGGEGGAA